MAKTASSPSWKKRIVIFLVAVLQTSLFASALQSHFNMQALRQIGATIDGGTLLAVIGQDIVGFAPAFFGVTLVAFLIAFPIASLVKSFVPTALGNHAYGIAGAAAIWAALAIMPNLMDITLIAAARTAFGIVALCFAGFAGGKTYDKFMRVPA